MKSTPKSIKPAVSAQGIATSKASSSLTGQTSMAAYGALGLALLHGIAGLSILIISSWFIAISAIAPLGFNYVIPAVVIRGLALLRIASGYTTMWLGHKDLLTRIAKARLAVFEQLAAKRLESKAWTVEALANHTEQLASAFIAWVSPLASVMLLMTGLLLTGYFINVPGYGFFIALAIVWLVISVVTAVYGLKAVASSAEAELEFRQQSATFFQASSLWHLKSKTVKGLFNAPSTQRVQDAQLKEQALVSKAMWLFQGGVFTLVALVVLTANTAAYFVPLALITPMVLLAAPDWASATFSSVVKLAKWRHSKAELHAMHTQPLPLLNAHKPSMSLSLTGFIAKERNLPAVNMQFEALGLNVIKGYSGCGKSSVLQAICGLLPFEGRRSIDNVATPQGMLEKWIYVEQQPIILAGTIKLNLDPAASGISEDAMHNVLARVGLQHLTTLAEWVGKGGRALSGGEGKRLALARALLAMPDVLLIDEPFEGLDYEAQQRVAEVINESAHSRLVIVATHVVPAALQPNTTFSLDEKGYQSKSPPSLHTQLNGTQLSYSQPRHNQLSHNQIDHAHQNTVGEGGWQVTSPNCTTLTPSEQQQQALAELQHHERNTAFGFKPRRK
ncbi:ATP-binding cassette domain-containing protein [Alteromonas sp. K632G]|jgi:ATP-binding cassette subfamily C protein CydC|uniref:ATP-binding cassette domain-containing protein n=1 Tax=Alteromonas sp. K632G TaxID=2820757 RepID=UPI001FCB1E30|nr:ATP-binding cassette domain-containing protein [Alteromonas sp. K632G]|tara:strand:+ start:446 stop:2299 length:1854 start_codon:yes stop_codon:yes gene_type:complete